MSNKHYNKKLLFKCVSDCATTVICTPNSGKKQTKSKQKIKFKCLGNNKIKVSSCRNCTRKVIPKIRVKKVEIVNECNATLIFARDINSPKPFIITKPGLYKLAEDVIHEIFIEKEVEGNFSRQLICRQGAIKITKTVGGKLFKGQLIYKKVTSDLLSSSNLPEKNSPFRYRRINNRTVQILKNNVPLKNEIYKLGSGAKQFVFSDNDRFCEINHNFLGTQVRGILAAIEIRCSNVTIDFCGHTIQQSKRFVIEQRAYSFIEIVPGKGDNVSISGIKIFNGTMGRSSHFAIRGTNVSNIIIRDMCFNNYEVAAIWLNDAQQPIIENCNISGLQKVSQPITELVSFKTTGTGLLGIVDCNIWGIILNDAVGQNSRMFAPQSHPILDSFPPHNGRDKSLGENRMLVGPRGPIVRNVNIGEIKSRMIQAQIIARRDKEGEIVPVLFSIRQGGRSRFLGCDEQIDAASADGFATYKHSRNPAYTELCGAFKITSDKVFDAKTGNLLNFSLKNQIIVKTLKVYKQVDEKVNLIGGEEEVCVDKFSINKAGCLCIESMANNNIVDNVFLKPHCFESVATYFPFGLEPATDTIACGTLISPRWVFTFDEVLHKKPNDDASNIVLDGKGCAVFESIERDCTKLTEVVAPKDVENRFKIASRCLQKDLCKGGNGKFPKLFIPNTDECDQVDRVFSTFFKHQVPPDELDEDTCLPKDCLTFIQVEDNFACDDFRFNVSKNPNGSLKVTHFDENKDPIPAGTPNTDGIPYVPFEGSYVTIRQGNCKGLTEAEQADNPCQEPNLFLQTLCCKDVLTIPLIQNMLSTRCVKDECGGLRTQDDKNGLDSAGHNQIGAFGMLLERSLGGLFENIEIVGSMVICGEGRWGESWWGLMANDSAFNIFRNIHVSNLPGNPGTVFGFHLSNGSRCNIVEDVTVQGATSEGEAYGIIVDLASESNIFRRCRASCLIGRKSAVGYVIRGRNNTFEDCEASRIIMVINKKQDNAADLIAAGFLLGVKDEEEASISTGNRLIRCIADNIRVISENEIDFLRIRDRQNGFPLPCPDGNRVFKCGLLAKQPTRCIKPEDPCRLTLEGEEMAPIEFLRCSLLSGDFILAGLPSIPSSRLVYVTVAAGILIIHQRDATIDQCIVDNVSSWGTAAGILITDTLFPHEHPVLNTGHCVTKNTVKHITSYFPGAVCVDKRDKNNKLILEEETLLIRGVLHTQCRTVKICLNICGDGTLDVDGLPVNLDKIDTPERIRLYLDPHVFGIADVRMCERNNFTPFFRQPETNKDINEILPLFVSDTLVWGNKVHNAINYWSKICNSYHFRFLNPAGINKDGTLTDKNLISSDLFLEECNPETDQDAFEQILDNIKCIKEQVLKEKNKDLYWTRDLNVHTLECDLLRIACDPIESECFEGKCVLLPPVLKDKINFSFCNSLQTIHKDGKIDVGSECALKYLPRAQRVAQCIQQKAYLLLTTKCTEDDLNDPDNFMFCDQVHTPDKHAENEALNPDPNEVESDVGGDCFSKDLQFCDIPDEIEC